MLFELGRVVVTAGVNEAIQDKQLRKLVDRYITGDWGDLDEEDKEMNDNAIKTGEDRILARYNIDNHEGIYIITEHDRSYTTIMFVSEY